MASANEAGAVGRPAALRQQDAEQVEGVGVRRVALQGLAVQGLGLVEAPGLMQADGAWRISACSSDDGAEFGQGSTRPSHRLSGALVYPIARQSAITLGSRGADGAYSQSSSRG